MLAGSAAEAPIVVDYSSDRYLESASDDWFKEATRLRDELRPVVERAEFAHFHLFYRGPVVLAPLIGALIARIKPLTIYTFENGRYEAAYTLDKRFLQG